RRIPRSGAAGGLGIKCVSKPALASGRRSRRRDPTAEGAGSGAAAETRAGRRHLPRPPRRYGASSVESSLGALPDCKSERPFTRVSSKHFVHSRILTHKDDPFGDCSDGTRKV